MVAGGSLFELTEPPWTTEAGDWNELTFSPSDFNWSTNISASLRRPPSLRALLGPLGFLKKKRCYQLDKLKSKNNLQIELHNSRLIGWLGRLWRNWSSHGRWPVTSWRRNRRLNSSFGRFNSLSLQFFGFFSHFHLGITFLCLYPSQIIKHKTILFWENFEPV